MSNHLLEYDSNNNSLNIRPVVVITTTPVADNGLVCFQIIGDNNDSATSIRIIQTYKSDVNVKLANLPLFCNYSQYVCFQ